MNHPLQRMPFLYARHQDTRVLTGLKQNQPGNAFRVTWVVKLAASHDMAHYDSGWMDCQHLGDSRTDADLVLVPDVDITEQVWVFDSDDAAQSRRAALAKMKELWSTLELV